MNHDVLRNVIHTSLLSVYSILYEEYKNEDLAKKNLFGMTKDVLEDLGLRQDLYRTYARLAKEFKGLPDGPVKNELYEKLTALQKAIRIVEEVNSVGRQD